MGDLGALGKSEPMSINKMGILTVAHVLRPSEATYASGCFLAALGKQFSMLEKH